MASNSAAETAGIADRLRAEEDALGGGKFKSHGGAKVPRDRWAAMAELAELRILR